MFSRVLPLCGLLPLLPFPGALAQNVVFHTGFEYPNGELPTVASDAAALNGAIEQVGTWSGELPGGIGEGAPNATFFREIDEDHFLLIDRAESSFALVANLTEAVPIAGTRVSYQFSTKRTGNHNKDSHVVGLDGDGKESFHIVASAQNNVDGESLRLGINANGDEAIWDFETVEGEDNDGDFPFNNSTGNTNNVGTIVLDLREDGYVMTVNKGLDNFLFKTALLPYNDATAQSLATIEIRANGGSTGVSTGMWLDDLTVSHSEGVSDPGLFVVRAIDFGNIPQDDAAHEKIVGISNSGETNTLTITGGSSTGQDAEHFAVTDFPTTLAPGEVGELTLSFDRKGETGDFNASIVLETNDPDVADQAAMLAVTAVVPTSGDTDEDGLGDSEEGDLGTDPTKSDTDGDGLKDGPEVQEHLTDPLVVDTDGDGFGDGEEVAFTSDPTKADADTDGDGLTDEDEFANGSNPGVADTDGDTINDGDEVNGNPPTDPTLADTDGDSISDPDERTQGTDGSEADTDGDSLDDGFELLLGSNPTDINSPVEGGGTTVAFQTGFEYPDGFPEVGRDARNLNGAEDQRGSFSGTVPEADPSGGLLDGENITGKDVGGSTFMLVDRPLEPHTISAEFVSPVPVAGSIVSFKYATRRTGSHSKDVSIVGVDENNIDVFHLVVAAEADPPDGERLGFLGPAVNGDDPEATFEFELVSGSDGHGDFNNVGANPGTNAISDVTVFLLAQGYVVNYDRPNREGYRTAVLPYRNEAVTINRLEIRVNGGATGVSSGFFMDDLVVETAGKPSDPNIIAAPRVNLGKLAVTPNQPASVRLLNTGETQPLEIASVEITGADAGHFTVAGFPAAIAAGGEGTIDLLFDAELRVGLFQAVLEVATNDPDVPLTRIEITAGGVDLAGPVAHFPLDETEGATEVQGISSNGLLGTIEPGDGSATLGADGFPAGTGLEVAGGGALRVFHDAIGALEELSVSMWVRAESTDDTPQTLFGKGEPPSPNIALILQGGNLAWFIEGDTSIGSTSGDAVVAGQTHHVVAVYGNDHAAIYVDGEEIARSADPAPLNLDELNAWFFGGFGSLTFGGGLDDVQLYERPLSAEDVIALRDNPGVPLSSGAPDPDPDPNPDPPVRRFAIPSLTRGTDRSVTIGWLAAQDVGYRVEFSRDLVTWAPIDDIRFTVSINNATLVDTNANRTGAGRGYYRVVLLP